MQLRLAGNFHEEQTETVTVYTAHTQFKPNNQHENTLPIISSGLVGRQSTATFQSINLFQ